jgi:GntR family transcriptional regulator
MSSNYRRKIPKYIQIQHWLRTMIEKGEIKRDDKLPTETELSHMFAANRMTVRKAMDSLVVDSMVIRQPGKGTFLVSEKPKNLIYTLKNITSFDNDMQCAGMRPTYQALEVKLVQADGKVSTMLKLKNDKRTVYSLRVLHADGEPVLIEKSYFPYSKFRGLLDMDFTDTLYQSTTEKFDIKLDHATQCLTAELSGEEETKIFGMPKPCPCMKMETVLYDPHNSPIEALFACYRGDKYKFRFKAGHYIRHSIM